MGGAFSEYVTWRWNFWINLPVSGLAFFLLLFFLDVHNPKTKMMDGIKAIDWFGSLSVLGLTLMLLLGLDFGGVTFAWSSSQVICLIVFGTLCSLLFIYSEKRLAKYPLMPLGIFSRLSNIAALAVTFAHGFVSLSIRRERSMVVRKLIRLGDRFSSPVNIIFHSTFNLQRRPRPCAQVS